MTRHCCACNLPMIENMDYDFQWTTWDCPHQHHQMIEHFDGRKDESFFNELYSSDHQHHPYRITNVSKPIKINGINRRISYCIIRYQDYVIARIDNYIMPYGLHMIDAKILLTMQKLDHDQLTYQDWLDL